MAKLISFRSGRRLGRQDKTANDQLVKKEGRYLGVLPSEDADYMRKWHDRLVCEQAQINELIDAYEQSHTQYLTDLTSVLLYLGFDPESYDPETEQLFISEDGHIWIVKKEE